MQTHRKILFTKTASRCLPGGPRCSNANSILFNANVLRSGLPEGSSAKQDTLDLAVMYDISDLAALYAQLAETLTRTERESMRKKIKKQSE